jgi:hypothetical protein
MKFNSFFIRQVGLCRMFFTSGNIKRFLDNILIITIFVEDKPILPFLTNTYSGNRIISF